MSAQTSSKQIILLIGLSIMGVIINIDYTAVNLALVTIAKELHTSLDTIQWILSGYVLAWAAVIIPAGKLSDKFGHRNLCTVGLGLFMLSSVMAGLSTSAGMIIASRVLQGMSGAIFVPALYALIYSNFPVEKRGMAIGIFSLGVGVGAAIGPTFGGFFLTTLGWSWIFYINVPITLLSMALILSATQKDTLSEMTSSILQPRSLILSAGIVTLVYAINALHHYHVFSTMMTGLFAATAVLLMSFAFLEKKSDSKIIPTSLLSNKPYLGCSISFSLEQYCFSSSFVALGLFMQNTLHYSAFNTSIIFLALSGIFAVVSSQAGKLVDTVGIKKPANIGFLLISAGCFWFTQLGNTIHLASLISLLLILGTGMGLVFAALNTGMVKTVQESEIGIASSIFVMLALIGNAAGVVVTTLFAMNNAQATSIAMTGLISLIGAGILTAMMRKPVAEAA